MVPWNAARTKVQIKLSIQRLRTLQEKKHALAKKSRRDIADLVQKGRIETAKLRVEGLIQDDIYVELLELLELYAETLQARFGLLDASVSETPEPSISDAVCAIVYAAPRTELKELHILREILMHKFGRNFSLSLLPGDNNPSPPGVPPRIVSKLKVFAPGAELVDAYLSEIASSYGVSYLPLLPNDSAEAGDGEGADDEAGSGDGDGGAKESNSEPKAAAVAVPAPAAPAREPSPLKSPDAEKKDAPPPPGQIRVVKKPTEDDELAARFERLKNLR
ncbi:Vacuolar protein sorting-associated protein IST1 [Vanrija pseudolonga]|uniref:Vacuolar protein sorting-associated protein IST1 n=1 Tax=Vanrija pseudolonga TaxID=143232 RepID=A0AAF0Y8C3_9TREE|nr:Vacuolar protein sorting-associated protein IST1 [Vanrija pseudolonga]